MHKVSELRKSFIDFFRERDHKIVPSSSLLPKDDPTLLFTTAGMVQFKAMFSGYVPYAGGQSNESIFHGVDHVHSVQRHLMPAGKQGGFRRYRAVQGSGLLGV